MKQSDLSFKTDVTFDDMLVTAGNMVTNLFGEPETRLNAALGAEYLYLQAATRLFTDYSRDSGAEEVEEFMNMVFAVGAERYEHWLRDNAGAEKYDAFKRMVERGAKLFADASPMEQLAREAGIALHRWNQSIKEAGGLSPDHAAAEAEQEKETPPQD
jgi:hypothetical protein